MSITELEALTFCGIRTLVVAGQELRRMGVDDVDELECAYPNQLRIALRYSRVYTELMDEKE